MKKSKDNTRILSLDILRAVAVLLVLCRHGISPVVDGPLPLKYLALALQRIGWTGVDLFFVLSGFLISSLLYREHQRTGTLHVKRFLIRRGFKIYPAFWLLILVTVLVREQFESAVSLYGLAGELLFIQNYGPHLWNHTWSLAVEEHFYIGLAALFFGLCRFHPKLPFWSVPAICLIVSLVCLVLRISAAGSGKYDFDAHLSPTHLRIDSLFFGVFLGYLHSYHNLSFKAFFRSYGIAIGCLSCAFLILPIIFHLETNRLMYTLGLTTNYLGYGGLLCIMLVIPLSANFITKAIGFAGSHSYSVYLWHMAVLHWLMPFVPGYEQFFWLTKLSIYCAASFLVGIVAAQILEIPMLRVRDFFFPSNAGALPTSASQTEDFKVTVPVIREGSAVANERY